jgi:cytochrome P450
MDRDRGSGWQVVREAGPVVHLGDTLMLTRREDVLAALRQPELFSSRKAFDQLGCPLPLIPITLDPPDHTRYRKLLQPYFSPHALADMTPSLREQAEELVAQLAPRGRCDAVADLALPYPSQVFLTMFGFPLADRDRLIGWKDAVLPLATQPNPDPADLAVALELFGYLTNAVAERRADPGDDLLSKLLTSESPLSDQDAIGLCFLFVMAGLDTVTSSLGSAMWKLATRPDLRRRLREDPERIGGFIEEILQLEAPVPAVPRVTASDVTVGGVEIPAETLVWLCIGAANREERDRTVPQDVQFSGDTPLHWAFGSGPHRCLGSHLARLEMRLVLTAWLARVPDFELAPGSDPRIRYPATTFAFDSVPLVYPAG